MIYKAALFTSCVKLLLIPAYHSTDFEVHRNWLAITYNLPITKWYYENTSEWTLDYPPFFAWFEYILSHCAKWFDVNMLQIENLNYDSFSTILFQRLTVILTDIVFIYGSHKCSSALHRSWKTSVVLPILLIANVGLLMVDHIHFQYNGFMYGLLLISIANVLQGQLLVGAFWFLVLLNTKHIYLYMVPAYFIYLLRNYCFKASSLTNLNSFLKGLSFGNTSRLAATVVLVFLVSFLPFLHQINQVLSRLFPFKRGLCHAYWAPNFWAVYNVIDKTAVVVGRKIGLNVTTETASMTGGLVQEFSHSILPNITPSITMVLTVCLISPALVKLWSLGNSPINFVRCMVICALTSFIFGWHVHEKAILMAIIPLSVLSVLEAGDAKVFLVLSTIGHYSLFPLLYPDILLPIKVMLHVLYSSYAFYSLSNMYPLHDMNKLSLPLLNLLESLYIIGLIPLFLYENIIHILLGLSNSLPYLPLMLTSVYCSFGVIYCWLKYYTFFINKCKAIT